MVFEISLCSVVTLFFSSNLYSDSSDSFSHFFYLVSSVFHLCRGNAEGKAKASQHAVLKFEDTIEFPECVSKFIEAMGPLSMFMCPNCTHDMLYWVICFILSLI